VIEDLDRRCQAMGIELSYVSEGGQRRWLDDDVKRALVDAVGEPNDEAVAEGDGAPRHPRRCFMPHWLAQGRAWGVTVQLFGVRSSRNLGIGDFEDAARLCELFGALGADFLGINPVHALFLADPDRTSPYFPSSRQYLNPLYIALDRLPIEEHDLSRVDIAATRAGDHVDYACVTRLKRRALEHVFARGGEAPAFEAFCAREGEALDDFATFEALGAWLMEKGQGAGWHGWPAPLQSARSQEVAAFRRENARRIRFHKWLQWLAACQLDDVQRRARAAGMRIGLYLDLAVGVAPDGAATWSRPESYARSARVGAPPDLFNSMGQDWGLAPIKPSTLRRGSRSAFSRDVGAAMRSAGAVRLDHAMGLTRLYWIPQGSDACHGGYVRYPLDAMLDALAERSQEARALVIGEDLGTVPPGFREIIERSGLLGYRVLYFERESDGSFRKPDSYAPQALACLSTHDLPPLAGWWLGTDLDTRERLGKIESVAAASARAERRQDRTRLMEALGAEGVITHSGAANQDDDLSDETIVGLHVFLARTPCRLVGIQIEDLARATDQVNVPGTHLEHRNWSLRLPITLEAMAEDPLVRRVAAAVGRERPRSPS
jgi:4-alpha-glucanotransferase